MKRPANCTPSRSRDMRTCVALASLAFVVATGPSLAARFDTYQEDGEDYCSLDLQGPDRMRISAERANGATGEVWVEFMADRDKSFSSEYELRLEITVDKDTTDAFLGGTEDTTNIPGFLIPLSTVGELATAPTFSYKIEDRPSETLQGLTGDEVRRLVDCMEQE